MNKRLKVPPKFPGEAAERAFWEKNESTAYLDWKKAQPFLRQLPAQLRTISSLTEAARSRHSSSRARASRSVSGGSRPIAGALRNGHEWARNSNCLRPPRCVDLCVRGDTWLPIFRSTRSSSSKPSR
jgi:hypothetical protein